LARGEVFTADVVEAALLLALRLVNLPPALRLRAPPLLLLSLLIQSFINPSNLRFRLHTLYVDRQSKGKSIK